MKIQSIRLTTFKRFTDLTIQNIPTTARLVILAGPNGCGKSSIFDALNMWRMNIGLRSSGWDPAYHVKGSESRQWNELIRIRFHDPAPRTPEEEAKAIYVRTAYRNEPDFVYSGVQHVESALKENRFSRMIDNDTAVSSNYRRILAQAVEDIFEKEPPGTTVGAFRDKAIGDIRDSVARIFPVLLLNSLGSPMKAGTFKFDKGVSKGFHYKNLSGGEKAVFDLLLDIVLKRREFNDTVFCIDEPEAHMNSRLQGALLDELYQIVPESSQLWLATHSVGMMRRARDLAVKHPGSVVFLDLAELDYDQPQIIEPAKLTRVFWEKALNVAIDDLASLIVPDRVVICEGKPLGAGGRNLEIDARCYNQIFENEYSDTRFLSGGNASSVETDRLALVQSIEALARGAKVIRLIDRDDLGVTEIAEKKKLGIKVLSQRHLESYLYSDEILTALCQKVGKPGEEKNVLADKETAVAASVARGHAPDDVKSAASDIYTSMKRRLGLTKCGNDTTSFMTETLLPLVRPETAVYKELRMDIFGV